MNRLGIIPAGGRADRFHGIFKELLPVGNESMLRRTVGVMRAGVVQATVVLTTPEKAAAHMRDLSDIPGVAFLPSSDTLFKSILGAMSITASWYLFAMPDTHIPEDTFYRKMDHDLVIGVFRTYKPDRFGIIQDGHIIDKPTHLTGKHLAWGALAWSKKVSDFWMSQPDEFPDFTAALNAAIGEFGFQGFSMDFYYDIATWEDYQRLINDVLPIRN